jgi:hypothetical protein
LPSGWFAGLLTKDTTAAEANLSHPPDLNGSISFALCEGHLTANFLLLRRKRLACGMGRSKPPARWVVAVQ